MVDSIGRSLKSSKEEPMMKGEKKMFDIINGYALEYRCGDKYAEVRKIGYIDEFGRLMDCTFVFRGSWADCIEYAKNH